MKQQNNTIPISQVAASLLKELPEDYIGKIRGLTGGQLKQFHLHLDNEIVNTITLWLENKADLNDECGCYATGDLLGMIIAEVWDS